MTEQKILIAEDELIIAFDLKMRLQEFGYTVSHVAKTGKDAIQKSKDSNPDLVLMDVKLRDNMNGIQAGEHIYNQLDIPVIYVTAYSDDCVPNKPDNSEHMSFVRKPFCDKELQDAIKRVL